MENDFYVLDNLKIKWFDVEMQVRALMQARGEIEQRILEEQNRIATLPTNKGIKEE